MKQNITVKQLGELSDKARIKYEEAFGMWVVGMEDGLIKHVENFQDYENGRIYVQGDKDIPLEFYPKASLGQLIEFLYKNVTVVIESEERSSPVQGWVVQREHHGIELCDLLWNQAKIILGK